MKLLRYLQWLLILLVGVPSALIITYLAELFLGYYPGFPGWKVGEIAATKNNVSICENIIPLPWPQLLGPTTSDNQITCIYEYAKLTKDPSACELLMPSSYGLSCVGAAEENDHCRMRDGYVASEDGSISYADCRKIDEKRTVLQNNCCLITRVTFVKEENDCSPLLSDSALHDECLSNLAFKNREPSICAEVKKANVKAACIVRASAMQKDPSICSGCKQPVEKLEDLK